MPSSLASPLAPNGFFALANLVGRSDQNLSALVPEMYIAVPGNQLKRIRLCRLHQDNSQWARRSAHSQRRYGTSRFNFGQWWPSRLVGTAKEEDRLNVSPNR